MPKYNSNRGRKRKAHTVRDERYRRSNKVKMYSCPSCSEVGGLVEEKNNNEVWAKCTRCNESGYDCRISDNHLVEHMDVYCTLVDHCNEEEDDEDEDDY